MFEQTFVQTQGQTRKPWTVAVSLSIQCLAIAFLLILPLLHPETLRMPEPPQSHLIRTWITQPPVPVQRTSARAGTVSVPVTPRVMVYVPPSAHSTQSRGIDVPTADPELTTWSGPSSAPFGPSLASATQLPPRADVRPPAIPTTTTAPSGGPLKISQGVAGASLILGPSPAYPQIAKAARSEGTVKLEATISADGSIRNLRVVSGPPLLVNAALEAVKQWRYRPTLLNGIAVEVFTEIDVNFSLSR